MIRGPSPKFILIYFLIAALEWSGVEWRWDGMRGGKKKRDGGEEREEMEKWKKGNFRQ
jgi:hypothetical protein